MKKSNLYAFMVISGFLGYPAVAGFSVLLNFDGSPVSAVFRMLVVVVAVMLFVTAKKIKIEGIAGILFVAGLVFWFFYFARIIYSTSISRENLSQSVDYYFMWSIGAAFLPFVALSVGFKGGFDWGGLLKSFFIVALIVSIAVVWNASTFVQDDLDIYDSGRLRLDNLNPIALGHLGVTLLLVSIFWILAPLQTRLAKLLGLLGVALGIYLMLASNSRGPLISLLFSFLLWFWRSRAGGKWLFLLLVIIILLLSGPLLAYVDELSGASTYSRMFEKNISDDVSAVARLDLYERSFYSLMNSPFFGAGLEGDGLGTYPHNVIIEAFLSTGIFIGFLFLIFYVGVVIACCGVMRRNKNFLWLGVVCSQYLFSALFSGSIYGAFYFWSAIGICIYAARVEDFRPRVYKF